MSMRPCGAFTGKFNWFGGVGGDGGREKRDREKRSPRAIAHGRLVFFLVLIVAFFAGSFGAIDIARFGLC